MVPSRRLAARRALAGLGILLLLSCSDSVTDPGQPPAGEPLATSPRAGLSPQATVASVTVSYHDGDEEKAGFAIQNKHPIWLTQPSISIIASVPRFDPGLGELLSAQLVIRGALHSGITHHAKTTAIYVRGEPAAFVSATANLDDPLLRSLTGQNRIKFSHTYGGSDEAYRAQLPYPGVLAVFQREEQKDGTYLFDQTYVGDDAQPFVGTLPLSMSSTNNNFLSATGHHDVDLIHKVLLSILNLSTDPAPGSIPTYKTAPLIVLQILREFNDHLPPYVDLHVSGVGLFDMWVTYIYEPNLPPVCEAAVASVEEVWPPNNRFVPIGVLGVTDPNDDPITITVDEIWQDEPTNTRGSRNFTTDGMGIGASTAQVRAERSGIGDGRVYHIAFSAEDDRGASCSGTVQVGVPHDQYHVAVDGGPLYDSTN